MPDVLEVIARVRKEGSLEGLNKELSTFSRSATGIQSILGRLGNVFTSVFDGIKEASKEMQREIAFDDAAREMGVNTDEYLDHLKNLTDGTVSSTDLMAGAIEAWSEDGINAVKAYEFELEAAWLEMSEGERAIEQLKVNIDELGESFFDSIANGLKPYVDMLNLLFDTQESNWNLMQEGQATIINMTAVLEALATTQMTLNEALDYGTQAYMAFYKAEQKRLETQRENIRAAQELREQARELNRANLEGVDTLEDLTRAEEKYWNDLEGINTAGIDKLESLQSRFRERREDLFTSHGFALQDSWRDHTRELADIEQRYRDQIEDINARSDIDLEEAIRRRDARGIVSAKRKKAESLNQAKRDRARAFRDEQQDYQREQADLNTQFQRKNAALEEQYNREFAALQASLARRRQALAAAYREEYSMLGRHLKTLNDLIESLGGQGLAMPSMDPGVWGLGGQTPSSGGGGARPMAFAGGFQHGGAFETTVPTSLNVSEGGQREGVVVAPGGLQNVGKTMGGNGGSGIRVHLTIEGDEIVKSIVRDVVVEELIEG